MNKTQIDRVYQRINENVRCTNGVIATSLNKKKKHIPYTQTEKVEMIHKGKAVLKSEKEIEAMGGFYGEKYIDLIVNFYTYPEGAVRTKYLKEDKKIETRKEEAWAEVEAAGKRLLDKVYLGLIDNSNIPAALEDIANMHKDFV